MEKSCGFRHGEIPKRLKGLPWKGSRSLIAARGFKSLFLRSSRLKKILKKVLTRSKTYDNIVKLTRTSGQVLVREKQQRTLITEQCKTLKIQKRFSFKTFKFLRSLKKRPKKTVKRERTANVVLTND